MKNEKLSEAEAARLVGISVYKFNRLKCQGKGPPFYVGKPPGTRGGCAYYHYIKDEVLKWAAGRSLA